ncbi:hypothetical protein MRB53_041101 [Persea americana]|nr:hypothetical protein MRB53_041101 [Persea americana]
MAHLIDVLIDRLIDRSLFLLVGVWCFRASRRASGSFWRTLRPLPTSPLSFHRPHAASDPTPELAPTLTRYANASAILNDAHTPTGRPKIEETALFSDETASRKIP